MAKTPVSLDGPRLKVERAKRHIDELRAAIDAFHAEKPYSFWEDNDTKTGENILRVKIEKCIPPIFSAMLGDIVHNLRSALDQLVCALVKANSRQVRRGNGFPISGTVEHFETNSIGKIKGVEPRAERFIRRLKPYKGGNKALWILHELDALDKHSGIITTSGANAATVAQIEIPIIGIGSGSISIGAVLPGQRAAVVVPAPMPRAIGALKDGMEILRAPADFSADIDISYNVTFAETKIADGDPVVETVIQLAEFVERVLKIADRFFINK